MDSETMDCSPTGGARKAATGSGCGDQTVRNPGGPASIGGRQRKFSANYLPRRRPRGIKCSGPSPQLLGVKRKLASPHQSSEKDRFFAPRVFAARVERPDV